MPRRKRPVLGVDYIIDTDGRAEFTAEFLLKRGFCCEHDCRYCPFPQAKNATRSSPDASSGPAPLGTAAAGMICLSVSGK
jgi:hypothetical protein